MKTNDTTKYYIYLRKSSEGEDRQVQSIERQADEVHRLVTHQDLPIVGTFEESRSAMTPNNRPEFTKMIKGIKAGKADGIVCWHINRLSRNPLESGIVQQLLEDGKIQRIITKDRDYTAADNAIIFSVESSLATQYSKDLGKMVRSGMDKRATMGIAPIKAPIGYLNTKMAEHGSNYIIKDPERFHIIRKLWDMMLTGKYGGQQILRIFSKKYNLKRMPSNNTGNSFLYKSAVYKILNNPFYTGMFLYKGKLYQGKHTAMISVEEFETVQLMLGKRGYSHKKKYEFEYTGFMKCHECGSAITAIEKTKLIKSTNTLKTYTYYYCTRRKRGGETCTSKKVVSKETLERMIIEELEKVTISERIANTIIEILQKNLHQHFEVEKSLSEQIKKEVIKIEKQLQNLLELRIDESVTDEQYQKSKTERENKILLLKQKLTQSQGEIINFTSIKAKLNTLLDCINKFKKSTSAEKKTILFLIGENWGLKSQKLLFDKHRWARAISDNQEGIDAEIGRLELSKYVDAKEFFKHFKIDFPLLCAVVDEVRTSTITNNDRLPSLTKENISITIE